MTMNFILQFKFNATLANHYSTYHFSDPYYLWPFSPDGVAFLFQPDQQYGFFSISDGRIVDFLP